MHKPKRSRTAALDQTWPDGVDTRSMPASGSSVSTLRVKLIGGPEEATSDGKTRPLAALSEHDPVNDTDTEDNVYWHDASSLLQNADRSYQPLAFAHTLPAIPIDELGPEDSGVREIIRLQLWLHPRDSDPSAAQGDGTPTMRVNPVQQGPLARAWGAWEQQSPGMTILTATVLCAISALAVSLFAH